MEQHTEASVALCVTAWHLNFCYSAFLCHCVHSVMSPLYTVMVWLISVLFNIANTYICIYCCRSTPYFWVGKVLSGCWDTDSGRYLFGKLVASFIVYVLVELHKLKQLKKQLKWLGPPICTSLNLYICRISFANIEILLWSSITYTERPLTRLTCLALIMTWQWPACIDGLAPPLTMLWLGWSIFTFLWDLYDRWCPATSVLF